MDTREYTAEDLALNTQFQQWVLTPTDRQHTSGNTGMPRHAVQRETIDRAGQTSGVNVKRGSE